MRFNLLLFIASILLLGNYVIASTPDDDRHVNGVRKGNHTLGLAYFLSIPPYLTKPGEYSPTDLMEISAIRYAVEKVNNYTDFLFGYKLDLRLVLRWSPWYDSLQNLRQITSNMLLDPNIAVLLGPDQPSSSFVVSNVLGVFCFPFISYGDTSVRFEFERESMCATRTVASNNYRIVAISDLVKKFQWSYIGVISSSGRDGMDEALEFISENQCSDFMTLEKESSNDDINDDLSILLNAGHNVIILFTSVRDTRRILKEIYESEKFHNQFHFVFANGKPILNPHFTNQLEDILLGSISIETPVTEHKDFKDYMLKRTYENTPTYGHTHVKNYFMINRYTKAWEQLFKCNVNSSWSANIYDKSCNKYLTPSLNQGYFPNTNVDNLFNLVYSAAAGFSLLIADRCNTSVSSYFHDNPHVACHDHTMKGIKATQRSKYYYIQQLASKINSFTYNDGTMKTLMPWDKTDRNVVKYDVFNFQKDSKGGYNNIVVGSWSMKRHNHRGLYFSQPRNFTLNTSMIDWGNHTDNNIPQAKCTRQCSWNAVIEYTHVMKCCWKCIQCPDNNIVINNKCQSCKEGTVALQNKCQDLPHEYGDIISSPIALLILMLSAIPLCITIIFFALIIKHRDNKIMTDAGEYFWYSLMVGLLFVPFIPIPYLLPPAGFTCFARVALPGIAYVIIYGSLVCKSIRILYTHHGMRKDGFAPPMQQLCIVIGLILVEGLVLVAYQSMSSPVRVDIVPSKKHFKTFCHEDKNPALFILSVVLGLVCMFIASIVGFKIRNIKKNHRETRDIIYTLYFSDVLWALFLPVFYHLSNPNYDESLRRYVMSAFSLTIAMFTVCRLYVRKIRRLVRPPTTRTTSQVERTSPDGCSIAARSRNCSNVSKVIDTKGWDSMTDAIDDMQSFIDRHCPPRRRRVTIDECEQVFDGNSFHEEDEDEHLDREEQIELQQNLFKDFKDDSDDESI